MPENILHEVKIQSASYGGDGVGRLADGRAVFVPYTITGELVKIRLTDQKKNFARGEVVEVIQPSLQRVTARCVHYGQCGGCHYQHLDYAAQLQTKRAILTDTLRRVGGIHEPEVPELVASPSQWRYRNHVQYHLTEDGRLGFQAGRSHRVIPVTECHLPLPAIDAAWQQFSMEPMPGLERIAVRAGVEDELQWILDSSTIDLPEVELDVPDSVVHLSPAGQLVLAGSSISLMRVKDRDFQVSAGAFFQVNTEVAGKMVDQVLAWLPEGRMGSLLDLYCGVGLFSAFCADRCDRLVGVELSDWACQDYAANLDAFDGVELYQGAAERVLPELDLRPDTVIVDPPRAGLAENVVHLLAKMQPGRILYVSCDPTTLARDLKLFAADGYHLEKIQPFDMFPQTFHVETVALLTHQSDEG